MTLDEFRNSLSERDLKGLDSEFTLSTRKLVTLFNADGAHLNRWWVLTPVEWTCPCCRRLKSQIVRLNKNNYLTCQLHEHHDHMVEVVKTLFEKYCTAKKQQVADELSERFAIKSAFSLSAYDKTIICFDCNKADADAKKIIKTHKFFSFSPKEISEFVVASPNKEHQINEEIAKNVWERVQPIFHLRMEMAEKFAKIASEKNDWYQPSEETSTQIERRSKLLFKNNNLLEIDKYEPEKILYNTDHFKGPNNSWRFKDNPLVTKRPSINELSYLIATKGKYWERYDESWKCPGCFRKKYECVRPSNKSKWVLEIKSAPLFFDEILDVNNQAEPMCIDCMNTAIELGREVIKQTGEYFEFPSSAVTLEELRQIVIPRPHSKHLFRNEIINQIIPSMTSRFKEFLEQSKIK
mgnify:CR=1 FL=1